jgi:hypothetical protein
MRFGKFPVVLSTACLSVNLAVKEANEIIRTETNQSWIAEDVAHQGARRYYVFKPQSILHEFRAIFCWVVKTCVSSPSG